MVTFYKFKRIKTERLGQNIHNFKYVECSDYIYINPNLVKSFSFSKGYCWIDYVGSGSIIVDAEEFKQKFEYQII